MKDARSTPAESPDSLAEERDWVLRSRAGDSRAFELLIERYRDRAYGLALRLVRSAPDAEEVAQDAFVRAWGALPRFRGDASFATWLYRIVWRRAIDRAAILRRRRDRETVLEDAGEAPGSHGTSSGPEEVAPAAVERWTRLTEGLSEMQRAAITLFYYQDRSVREVARVLEIPEGTVKTHLSRARAALRERYRSERKEAEDAL